MIKEQAIQYLMDMGISPEHIIELAEALSHSENPNRWIAADVLDKIRAEIDSYCSDNRDRNDGLYIAMGIIDKYQASPAQAERSDKE